MRVIVGVTEFKAEFSGMLDLHKRFVCKEFTVKPVQAFPSLTN